MAFSADRRQPRYRFRGIRHFGTISRILLKHGLSEFGERLRGHRQGKVKTGLPDPVRVRRALEDLGPSFIKLGQLLSTRGDVLPPDYIEELSKLQDQVPPVPFETIRPVIESELRQSVDDIFERIDHEALAAASVAQVHVARLKSGEKVAVKIIRPGIHKRIQKDLHLMYYFAAKIEKKMEIGRILGAVNLVKEFERTIFRELNMMVEAGHIERFAASFKEIDEIYIPKVYWQFTSKSVLVMEHIQGIKMDNVAEIKRHGIDPQEVAMIGLRSFSRQLMEVGIFHADPHPGNTLVMTDGRVSLVDFGIVGYLDEETMLQVAHVFLGFSEHDYDMVMEAFESAGLINADSVDLRRFRIDLKDMAEPFYGRSLKTISVKDVYDQTMRLVFKYQIRLPRNLLLLLKTFIQTEALGKILDSDASLLEVTKPYAKKLMERGYEAQKILKNMGREFRAAGGYMRWMPKLTHDILRRIASGDHHLELEHSGLVHSFKKFESGLNRLTIGLVISASLIAASLILNSSKKVVVFNLGILGMESVSITELLGLTGYSIATLLGLWLIFSIFRSGRL
jgi:ubiquinone biosynthesis protein